MDLSLNVILRHTSSILQLKILNRLLYGGPFKICLAADTFLRKFSYYSVNLIFISNSNLFFQIGCNQKCIKVGHTLKEGNFLQWGLMPEMVQLLVLLIVGIEIVEYNWSIFGGDNKKLLKLSMNRHSISRVVN